MIDVCIANSHRFIVKKKNNKGIISVGRHLIYTSIPGIGIYIYLFFINIFINLPIIIKTYFNTPIIVSRLI